MIINLTPHEVAIYNTTDCLLQGGRLYLREEEDTEECLEPLRVYPAADVPARVVFDWEVDGVADGVCIMCWKSREFSGLPEPKPDTWYIVSRIFAQTYPERSDLLIPGDMVRDKNGAVVGCINFTRL